MPFLYVSHSCHPKCMVSSLPGKKDWQSHLNIFIIFGEKNKTIIIIWKKITKQDKTIKITKTWPRTSILTFLGKMLYHVVCKKGHAQSMHKSSKSKRLARQRDFDRETYPRWRRLIFLNPLLMLSSLTIIFIIFVTCQVLLTLFGFGWNTSKWSSICVPSNITLIEIQICMTKVYVCIGVKFKKICDMGNYEKNDWNCI